MNKAQPAHRRNLSDVQIKALAARIDRPIVLVGMMGVGKTSIGKRLAQKLGVPFFDADEEIVEAAQMSITEIFDQYGEDYFRDGERRVIARLLEEPHSVIATGGGAFVQDDTRAEILEKGIAVWLDCEVDTLVERVSRNKKRPLLRGGNVREKITSMKTEREPSYAKASIRVTSDTGPHGETVDRILEALNSCL